MISCFLISRKKSFLSQWNRKHLMCTTCGKTQPQRYDVTDNLAHNRKNKIKKIELFFCILYKIACILNIFFVLKPPTHILISCQAMQIRKVIKGVFYRLSLSWRSARVKTCTKLSGFANSEGHQGRVLSSVIVMALSSGKNMHQIKYSCAHRSADIKANTMLLLLLKANY